EKLVKNPLNKRKIGAYYGCLLLRPNQVMSFDDPENPSTIEQFIKALGGEPVKYPYRTECCGGYLSLDKKDMATGMASNILSSASKHEIDEIVTACPLCKYNLEISETKNGVTISYFTELLAEALGLK
ncbi:MAG: disulfide reductase, partial [Clostridia bacterium]|nr:disulfide reductase [Clostridia bacterium]